jgi:hypothetical protein
MRGVIPAPARSTPIFAARRAAERFRLLVTQHVSEPATHPPKALRGLS